MCRVQPRPEQRLSRAAQGERLVAAELRRQGWLILAQNLRHVGFELDLVARKGTTLAIVEVKARRHELLSAREAAELLSTGKQRSLRRGAIFAWQRFGYPGCTVRIDLAYVFGDRQTLRIHYWPNCLPIEP